MTHDPWNAIADRAATPGGGAGPLADVRTGIKSNIAVAGLPHTGGMAHLRGNIAPRDAAVVTQLRAAGAGIVGTLNMHEAALGATTDNAFYGRTHNPHRIGHTPGGSSGGSGAAVAAGLVDLALGTDTLGSIRLPAAYCGVYGLKPTHGAVRDDGLLFLDPAFDTIGPLARDLDLIERAWDVIGNKGSGGGSDGDFSRLVLLDDLAGVACEPAVLAGWQAARAALDLPARGLRLPAAPTAVRIAALAGSVRYLIGELGPHRADASAELRFILDALENVPADPALLSAVKAALVDALGDDGVLLLPTAPQAAFAHGGRAPASQADFTGLANIAGLPALALPSGWSDDGLPVSVQLVGGHGSERRLIGLARRLDAALNQYRPPKGE
jgi:aspartyl-tRNA(Asn)/glutamyl-tRNA(Gln) amidotransferase subunit A